ncbi:hypothetical protein Bca52824_017818 [Brassica carinata]|uniref:Uncharacterized protein n=1 Tax=Brassica carinata TaxID=52824 RepID=A0A8X7VNS2_BRACI|nr:hypothetical protein Bca52824_017818 [Brassica carinata]
MPSQASTVLHKAGFVAFLISSSLELLCKSLDSPDLLTTSPLRLHHSTSSKASTVLYKVNYATFKPECDDCRLKSPSVTNYWDRRGNVEFRGLDPIKPSALSSNFILSASLEAKLELEIHLVSLVFQRRLRLSVVLPNNFHGKKVELPFGFLPFPEHDSSLDGSIFSGFTRVVNYVAKEIGEMFPQWDNDQSDVAVENLVKFMFAAKANWKWTQECWPVKGTTKWTNPVFVKQEPPQPPADEERRALKKARTEAYTETLPSEDHIEPPSESSAARNRLTREEIEQMFKEMTKVMTTGFGQCVKEIKLLGDRMEAMEKKLGNQPERHRL